VANTTRVRHEARKIITSILLSAVGFAVLGCSLAARDEEAPEHSGPSCEKALPTRIDAHQPYVIASDWGKPVRLAAPINTPCPEDAIEISADGKTLYFFFSRDLLENLTPAEMLAPPNGTYRAERREGSTKFDQPVFYDLGKGSNGSLDGELSFTPDGKRVYFHSLRAANIGYQADPPTDDFLDIYVADIVDGEPQPARNLGKPVNSIYPDGEHALYPDGVTLYFTSSRPDGLGNNDIWRSTWDGTAWSDPIALGAPVNSSGNELQPAFTADGQIMYFTSDRDASTGLAIYRSTLVDGMWSRPELVLGGIVGEASITGDGQYLYFVHVLTDAEGVFDADIWVVERQ
jgi:Tol biopolymer transport system component